MLSFQSLDFVRTTIAIDSYKYVYDTFTSQVSYYRIRRYK